MRSRTLWKTVPSATAMALAAVYATAAQAQTEEPGVAEEGGLAEIVVTAQKRTETLSRTAAAVSVVGQQTLDNLGVRRFEDAVTAIPNLSAPGLGSTLSIRGLGSNTLGQGNSTVATHIDGVFYRSFERGPAGMYDIARIEVLRGPQGTLYGRNATAGVVNIITNNANTEKVEAFGDIGYASFDRFTVRGAVNVPISDAFAVRLTGGYESGGNHFLFANGDRPKGADVYNLRLAWRAKPTDWITWDGRVSYIHDNSASLGVATPAYRYDPVTGTFVKSSNPIGIFSTPPGIENDGLASSATALFQVGSLYKGVNLEEATRRPSRDINVRSNLNFELSDQFSLTYVAGYSHSKELPGTIVGLHGYLVKDAFETTSTVWSHELNLNYQSDRLKAILGLYSYQRASADGDQIAYIFLDSIDSNNLITYSPGIEQSSGASTGLEKARAIFGQATFDVTDTFRVTGGARYNWDSSSSNPSPESSCPFGSGLNGQQPAVAPATPFFLGLLAGFGINLPAGTPACLALSLVDDNFYVNRTEAPRSSSSTAFTWKAGVEYDVAPDTMAYATVSTGYKAGAAGTSGTNGVVVRPETDINYEVGIRSRLFNNTLSLNLTAFWTDYKDQQITTTNPANNTELILVNAGKTRTRGIEFEYAWAPTPNDRINGYVNYLDAKFLDFEVADDLIGYAFPPGTVFQFAGNRMAGAPEFSGRIAYSHIFDLGNAGTITPSASLYWQTKTFVSYTNHLPTMIPGYTRTDINVRYETADKRFSLEGFINNLENEVRVAEVFPLQGVANTIYTPPRSYGVRLGFRY